MGFIVEQLGREFKSDKEWQVYRKHGSSVIEYLKDLSPMAWNNDEMLNMAIEIAVDRVKWDSKIADTQAKIDAIKIELDKPSPVVNDEVISFNENYKIDFDKSIADIKARYTEPVELSGEFRILLTTEQVRERREIRAAANRVSDNLDTIDKEIAFENEVAELVEEFGLSLENAIRVIREEAFLTLEDAWRNFYKLEYIESKVRVESVLANEFTPTKRNQILKTIEADDSTLDGKVYDGYKLVYVGQSKMYIHYKSQDWAQNKAHYKTIIIKRD